MSYKKDDSFICAGLNKNYVELMKDLVDDLNKLNDLGIGENLHTETEEVYNKAKENLFYKLELLNLCMPNFTNILENNTNYVKVATVKTTYINVKNPDFMVYFLLCNNNYSSIINKFADLFLSFGSSEFNIESEKISNTAEYEIRKAIVLDFAKTFLGYVDTVNDFCAVLYPEVMNILEENEGCIC